MLEQATADRWALGTAALVGAGLQVSSRARYSQVFDSFIRYAQAHGVEEPSEVTSALCWGFVTAAVHGGQSPCPSTSRLRLTAIRSVFRGLLSTGVLGADPTLDLRVSHRAIERVPVPLTPPEARRLVLAGRSSPRDTLRPATSALALLGAAHAEVAGAVVADFHGADSALTLGSGEATRLVAVPSHLCDVIRRRVVHQRTLWARGEQPWKPSDVPLALKRPMNTFPVNAVAPTVSNNLGLALRHAGIHRAGVQPKSIREYAANELYATTQHIETVAEQLGLSSYDTAARLIDRAWQERWGETLRREARE